MRAALIFVLILGLTFILGQWLGSEKKNNSLELILNDSSCDPTESACEFKYKKNIFHLDFQGSPSGLVPFYVSVKSESVQPESIELSFDMQGMDMGYNVHNLKKSEAGWSAKVILPICSLARNDWLVNVKLVFDNDSQITEFRFSQAE